MNPIIRLTLRDRERISALNQICFPLEHNKQETWVDLLDDERTHVFAIEEDLKLVALIAIYNWKGENDYIKIMSIGTHPDYRGLGHGHRLMQHIIDEMLKDDMRKFRAETRETNFKMQRVFEDFGYKIIDKVDAYYDNPTELAFKYGLDL